MVTVGPYEVVLATHNGAVYLDQQLASINAQSVRPQRILVADDGSSDGTPVLLECWRQRSGVPLEILPALSARQGICGTFERLLAYSADSYVTPADQNEIWEPDKASLLLQPMAALEQRWGVAKPLLVHADLSLIDAAGCYLGAYFHCFQGLQPERAGWLAIVLQNVVIGCACLVNRACLEQALPFPAEVVLHDWCLTLVEAHQGAIGHDPPACGSASTVPTRWVAWDGVGGWAGGFSRGWRRMERSGW